jgi:hypothetical protein
MNEFAGWQKVIFEWKKVQRMKKLNQELYDQLGGTFLYILQYARKNNIILPNTDSLDRMADRIHHLMDEIEQSSDETNTKGN